MEEIIEFAEERSIEEVVKRNGRMLIVSHDTDWDEEGNFIGNYSETYKKAEGYVRKYNPRGLSHKEYLEAYSKGELPWQFN